MAGSFLSFKKEEEKEIPRLVPPSIGQVQAISGDNIIHVHFPDIEANHPGVRGKVVKFQGDKVQLPLLSPGDWAVGQWNIKALTPLPTPDVIRLEGPLGRAHLQPLDKRPSDSWQQKALEDLKKGHEKRFTKSPVQRTDPDPHMAVRTMTAVPSGNFSSGDYWLPTPVPMPISDEEWLFDDHYFRIGYVSFTLDSPAQDIQITETMPFRSVPTIRSRTPIQKDNWHATQQITFSLTLNGIGDINAVLLPLVRLFRRAPFLPVFNKTLLERDITALALQGLAIETVPGFPNCLRARFVCYSFNWEVYFPAADQQEGLDALFCYPLLKIWAEAPVTTVSRNAPMLERWDGEFRLMHPAESWIKAVTEFPVRASKHKNAIEEKDSVNELKTTLQYSQGSAQANANQPEGFDLEMGTNPGVAGEKRFLSKQWGRVILSDGKEYIFFRPTTAESARKLIDSPDLVEVVAGTVEIERVTPQPSLVAQAHFSSNSVLWKRKWDGLSPVLFKQQLLDAMSAPNNPGDNNPLTILAVKGYTFVFLAPALALDKILSNPIPAEPVDLAENIGADDSTAFEPPGFVIEQINATVDNTLAPLQVRGHRTPTFQYLGSHAIYYTVVGTMQDSSMAGRLQDFMERVNYLGRRYRGNLDGSPFGGFIIVENEIFRLLGTTTVMPIGWETSSIPGFPRAMRFQLTLVEFDPTQRRIEALRDLNEGADKNPLLAHSSQQDPLTLNYWRQSDFNRRLRLTEIYPDLALPTHKQLAKWLYDIQTDQVWDWDNKKPHAGYEYLDPDEGGTGWQWSLIARSETDTRIQGLARTKVISAVLPDEFLKLKAPKRLNRFADPDFYCAPSQNWGKEFVDKVVKESKNISYQYTDTYGTKALSAPGRRMTEDSVLSDPQGTIAKARQSVNAGSVLPIGATFNPIDSFDINTSPIPTISPQGEISNTPVVPASQISMLAFPQPSNVNSNSVTANEIRRLPEPPSPIIQPLPTPGLESVPILNRSDTSSKATRFRSYQAVATMAANSNGVPLDWFFAVIDLESEWIAQATSKDGGALGLGQLRRAARQETGLKDPFDPVQNLNAAAKYLRNQANKVGSWERAVAAYNQGARKVLETRSRDGIPNEARTYVTQVMDRKAKYAAILQQTSLPTRSEEATLSKMFAEGHGYSSDALQDYLIQDAPTITPLPPPPPDLIFPKSIVALPGLEADRRRLNPTNRTDKRFIDPKWLQPAHTDPTKEGKQWFYIKPEFLSEFLHQMSRHNVLLTGEKIPARIPGKFDYNYSMLASPGFPKPVEQVYHEPDEDRDVFHDLRKEMIQGRLLGAFPTFYVAIVDGGRSLRVWRLYDHVYGMLGITQIAVHRTRKGPIDTAVVGMSNMYNHLTSQSHEVSRIQAQDTRGVWNIGSLVRSYQGWKRPYDGETLEMWAQHLDRIMLRAGARLHIRLGYGSDAVQLPIVFNGVISEVPINEGEIEVVALSDGIELINEMAPNALQGSMPVTRLNSLLGGGLNPRELVMSFLAPNPWANSLKNAVGQALNNSLPAIGNFFYYGLRNEYGIEHFGSPIRKFLGYDDGEIGINIYNPEHSKPLNKSSAWDDFARIFQPTKWDKNQGLVGVNMGGATPWAIFDMVRHVIPDYILAVEPVELRSTVFMGKGWFPLYGNYRDEIDGDASSLPAETPREKLFQWKPFQQFHVVDANWNLCGNFVRADLTNVVTKVQAIGTYNGWKPGSSDMSNEASFVMMLDEYIHEEFQKLKIVESGLYSTFGMKTADAFSNGGGGKALLGLAEIAAALFAKFPPLAIAGVATFSEPFVRSFMFSRRVLDHYAAMTLKDHVKEMYQGPLVILGNGHIKPFDYLGITDQMSGLNGLAETREVTHLMSLDTGFITQVIPDCIANYQDFEGQDLFVWLANTASHFAYSLAGARLVGNLSRSMSTGASLKALDALEKSLITQIAEDKKLGGDIAKAVSKEKVLADLQEELQTARRLRGAKNSASVRALLSKIFSNEEYLEALSSTPVTIRSRLALQKFLLGLPSSKAAQFATKATGKASDLVSKIDQKIPRVGIGQRFLSPLQLAKKQKELRKLVGGKNELIDQVRKKLISGVALTEEEKLIAATISEVEEMKGAVKAVRVAAAARKGFDVASDALTWSRQLFNKSGAMVVIAGVINIAIGSFADWAVRWAIARQCLTLLPLRTLDRELSAGITGHRGAVYGDVLIGKSALLQGAINWVKESPFGQLIPVLRDLADAGVNYQKPAIPAWLHSPDQRHDNVP